MRCFLVFILAVGITAAARADVAPNPQIAAAVSNAVDHAAGDIAVEPITSSLSVGAFLDRTHSRDRLSNLLQKSAQQIGGPRWLDEQTCQVLINIPAPAVRQALEQIATDNRATAPLDAAAIARDLKSWDTRSFSAIGTATARLEAIRPPPSAVAWQGSSGNAIGDALIAARQDAVNHVLDSIASIPLAGGKTIGDALKAPAFAGDLADWIGNRPVMLVDFRDDQTVEVTLSLSPDSLSAELRAVLAAHPRITVPADEKAWGAIDQQISQDMALPRGAGKLVGATQPSAAVPLPAQPPDWADRQLDTDASGVGSNPLLAARAAETAALAKIRAQVDALPLNGKTLADAARQDPRLASAVERALNRSAHVYNVDDHGDGTVSVRMSMDLRDLWQAIAEPR